MTDHRLLSELTQRRQVYARITELNSSCGHLTSIRDDLYARLGDLNKIVDELIAEKRDRKYSSVSDVRKKAFPTGHESLKSPEHHRKQAPISTTTTNGPTGSLCLRSSNPLRKSPSDTFRTKLSHCLQEIAPKAEEIADLSERLYCDSEK